MADFRVIMTLVFKGRSYREIVAAAGCSHRDVSVARKVIADRGITEVGLAGMSDAELAGLFPDGRAHPMPPVTGVSCRWVVVVSEIPNHLAD